MEDALVLSAGADGVTQVWNLRTLTVAAAALRDNTCAPRSLALLPPPGEGGRGEAPDAFLSAHASAPALLMYSMHRDAPLFKCAMPESMLATAVPADGKYVAAGGASGRVYVWDAASGDLLRSWQAHYKAVTAAVWSPCGTLLVTGSADGMVRVWPLAAVVDIACLSDLSTPPEPRASWTDHALGVSALVFGPGLGAAARLYSASADWTVRLWDVASGRCLHTLPFPAPLTSLAVDVWEARLLAAATDGAVYVVDLAPAIAAARAPGATLLAFSEPAPALGAASDLAYAAALAAGGATASAGSRSGGAGVASGALLGHTGAVHAVALSEDGSTAVSGGADGKARVWDVASRQLVAMFEGHDAPVTAVVITRRPPPPVRGGGGGARGGTPADVVGVGGARAVVPLKKHQLPLPPDWRGSLWGPTTATLPLPIAPTVWRPDDVTAINAALGDAIAALLAPPPATAASHAVASSTPAAASDGTAGGEDSDALRSQVAALQDEVARWKAVNTQLLARLTAAGVFPAGGTASKRARGGEPT